MRTKATTMTTTTMKGEDARGREGEEVVEMMKIKMKLMRMTMLKTRYGASSKN